MTLQDRIESAMRDGMRARDERVDARFDFFLHELLHLDVEVEVRLVGRDATAGSTLSGVSPLRVSTTRHAPMRPMSPGCPPLAG